MEKLLSVLATKNLQDEDSKLRALISNNFGRRKNDPNKDRKALETYVSLRGFEHGGSRCQVGTLNKITLDDIAKELNMSKRNLQRALSIERNLTDSMKDLNETNIRQRGIGNPNPVKLGRCIVELERLYGIEHGGNRGNQYVEAKPNNSVLATQEQLAAQLGISVDTLQNYKMMANMIPELQV